MTKIRDILINGSRHSPEMCKAINKLTMQRLGWIAVTNMKGEWNIYPYDMMGNPIKCYPYSSAEEAWDKESVDFCDSLPAVYDLLHDKNYMITNYSATVGNGVYHSGRFCVNIVVAWNMDWEINND